MGERRRTNITSSSGPRIDSHNNTTTELECKSSCTMCNLDSTFGVCLVVGVQAEECHGLSNTTRTPLWYKRRGTAVVSQVVTRTSCTLGTSKTGGAPVAKFPKPPCEPHIAGETELFSSSSCAWVAENRFANEFMARDDAQLQVWTKQTYVVPRFYQPPEAPCIDLTLRLRFGSF